MIALQILAVMVFVGVLVGTAVGVCGPGRCWRRVRARRAVRAGAAPGMTVAGVAPAAETATGC
jgi:hypothetical protein